MEENKNNETTTNSNETAENNRDNQNKECDQNEKCDDNNTQNAGDPKVSNVEKFFNEVGRKADVIAKATVDKSKEIIEVTKLNFALSRENENLKNAYTELGVVFYESIKDSENNYQDACNTIESCLEKIAEIETSINTIKGYNTCSACRHAVEKTNHFCGNCGKKM